MQTLYDHNVIQLTAKGISDAESLKSSPSKNRRSRFRKNVPEKKLSLSPQSSGFLRTDFC